MYSDIKETLLVEGNVYQTPVHTSEWLANIHLFTGIKCKDVFIGLKNMQKHSFSPKTYKNLMMLMLIFAWVFTKTCMFSYVWRIWFVCWSIPVAPQCFIWNGMLWCILPFVKKTAAPVIGCCTLLYCSCNDVFINCSALHFYIKPAFPKIAFESSLVFTYSCDLSHSSGPAVQVCQSVGRNFIFQAID